MRGWDGIEEFVAVANAGSFNAGAITIGRSTTHMSRSIARLEQQLQAQLLQRTTRTVRLTDTGQIFLAHCERMVAERDEAVAMVSQSGEPQGELRLTCSIAMGEEFIAPIVRQFCLDHSGLSVSVELTNRIIDIVAENFDLAIRTGQLADSRLIGTRVASRRFYTCAAPSYLDAHGRPADYRELEQHQCLIGTAATWHFNVDGEERVFKPRGRWRCNSGRAVVEAALADMGICQLPEFYLLPFIHSGKLEVILADFEPAEQPIWAIYPQRRHLLPKISRFVDVLRSELPAALNAGIPAL
jgi:DNA-binding transcriptional LysR family regulator